MAIKTNIDIANEFDTFLDDIYEEYFKYNVNGTIHLNGNSYMYKDIKAFKKTIVDAKKAYKKNISDVSAFLRRNKEYNKHMRMYSYYNNKNNKSDNDYKKIEEHLTALDRLNEERKEKRETLKIQKMKNEQKYKEMVKQINIERALESERARKKQERIDELVRKLEEKGEL